MILTRKLKLMRNEKSLLTVDGECQIGHKRRMQEVSIEAPVLIGNNSIVESRKISAFCTIGKECDIKRTTLIGRYTTIGDYCQIGCKRKDDNNFFSNCNVFVKGIDEPWHTGVFKWSNDFRIPMQRREMVSIGNDVWIGDSVIILEGVKIGDGAIIQSGSVVLEDVAPYSVVAGNPACEVKKRFSSDIIDELLSCMWWDKSLDDLDQIDKNCQDIHLLIRELKNINKKQQFLVININSKDNEIIYEENKKRELMYKL